MKKKNKSGFTLLEMLVVVLIIGILAGIALPQYQKAVEKAKLTEALLNIKTIQGAAERYILAQGLPQNGVAKLKDYLDIDLSGGEWIGSEYYTRDFEYGAWIDPSGLALEIYRKTETRDIYVIASNSVIGNLCITQDNDMGRYICKYLETQGFEYYDDEI